MHQKQFGYNSNLKTLKTTPDKIVTQNQKVDLK